MSTKEKLQQKQLEEKQIADEEYEYVTIPPDGVFRWLVALAAMVFEVFIINIRFDFVY